MKTQRIVLCLTLTGCLSLTAFAAELFGGNDGPHRARSAMDDVGHGLKEGATRLDRGAGRIASLLGDLAGIGSFLPPAGRSLFGLAGDAMTTGIEDDTRGVWGWGWETDGLWNWGWELDGVVGSTTDPGTSGFFGWEWELDG